MYPQPGSREPGKGGNPTSGKIQKITPEWQTEQFRSVDSAVARVKGKHHDGDVIKGTVYYAVNSGGTASSLVLSDVRAFFIERRRMQGKDKFS